MLTQVLTEHLLQLKAQGLYRQRQCQHAASSVNFSSNDYLSLAADEGIKRAYQDGFKQLAVGSGGSMMVCGYQPVHKQLEQTFSQALNVDDCLLFSSGYAANVSVISLLSSMNASILLDKGVHASFYDGIRLSRTPYSRYLHNDVADLSHKLKQLSNAVLITEAIFSMSGQLAPLNKMVNLGQQYNSALIVDEAHAFGILGREGLGSVEMHQLTQAHVPLRIIPFGKAYGASGAVVAGCGVWIDALLQTARPAIYSTAISPAYAYGLLHTLDVVRRADERRAKLQQAVDYFRAAIKKSSLVWRDSVTPIQQLQLGCPHRALLFAAKLQDRGIFCQPMRYPTVTKPETGLRVILNYNHDAKQIDYLFDCLRSISESERFKLVDAVINC